MHVVLVQLDIVWEDKPANQTVIESMLDAADVPAGALVVLPELGDTGFSFDLDRIVDDRTVTWGREMARRRGVWLQIGYAVHGDDGKGRNCATLVRPDGGLVGTYQKVHPFTFGRESEHYGGGDTLLVRRCADAIVCPMICYDLRFPELWIRNGATDGGRCVCTFVANWPDAKRQANTGALWLIARAIENQAYVAAVNRCGRDPYLGYAGGSIVVSPAGEVLAEAGTEPAVLRAELDLPALRAWRAEFPALRDIRPELLGNLPVDADA